MTQVWHDALKGATQGKDAETPSSTEASEPLTVNVSESRRAFGAVRCPSNS